MWEKTMDPAQKKSEMHSKALEKWRREGRGRGRGQGAAGGIQFVSYRLKLYLECYKEYNVPAQKNAMSQLGINRDVCYSIRFMDDSYSLIS